MAPTSEPASPPRRASQRAVPLLLAAIALTLVAARIVTSVTRGASEPVGTIRWVDPGEALQLAAATNKVILYDFTAEWCQPCHMLDAEVFSNPALAAEINERFIAVRLTDTQQERGSNAPRVEALQRQFGVRGFPTVVFADASGTERGRMEGFGGRAQFERIMEQVR